jgi:hypothetical protein
MGKWVTFRQIRDDDGDKSGDQKVPYDVKADFIRLMPEGANEAFQEFENAPFGHPDEQGVEDARC